MVGVARVGIIAFWLSLGTACAGTEPASYCELVADGFPSLDAPDAVERWEALESAAPAALADAVVTLRVTAARVARLGPRGVADVAALTARPAVGAAAATVAAHVDDTCR